MAERQRLRLDALATIMTGATPPASQPDSWGDDVDFITPSDQYDGQRTASPSRRLSQIGAERLRKRLVPSQSTNLTCIGSIGKVTMAAGPSITNQQINTLVAKPGIADPVFLYYMVKNWSGSLKGHASGSATPIVNKSVLSGYEFEVPGLPEQRAIAEVLGALDDKIAANTKLAETSMDLSAVIYRHGTASFPERPMNEVLTPILGGTPSRSRTEFWGGDVLWASAKDVTGADNGVITDTEEKITGAAASQTKAKPLRAGSVILTARGTVGAVARLATPASFNQSCYGFVPGDLPPGMLYFGILGAAKRAKSIAHGSVFDTITMKTFAHLQLPDMSATEITNLESLISPLLDLVVETVKENRTLAATRDALLPQLMSGKLRVRDIENTMGEMV